MERGEQTCVETPPIFSLPTEILLYIFKHLSGTQLLRCRDVCVLWKQVVENEETMWQEICKREHRSAFAEARSKCHPSLSWCCLYQSLCVWPQLASAKDNWRVFAESEDDDRRIKNVKIKNGAIVVHRQNAIEYYDMGNLEQTHSITGAYEKYDENDHLLVLICQLSNNLGSEQESLLRIIPKVENRPIFEDVIEINNVNSFRIGNKDVYYSKLDDHLAAKVYVCKFDDNYKTSVLLHKSVTNKDVWSYCFKDDKFEMLLSGLTVYTLVNEEFFSTQLNVRHNTDYLFHLSKFSMLKNLNYVEYYTNFTIDMDNRDWPALEFLESENRSLFKFMHIIYNTLFVATSTGKLRIYECNKASGEFDVNNPTKEYIIDKYTSTGSDSFDINTIDGVETEYGPVVVLSTANKVVMLNLRLD